MSFGLGLGTALLGVAAKYVMDYPLARRRLEMDERAEITLSSDPIGTSTPLSLRISVP